MKQFKLLFILILFVITGILQNSAYAITAEDAARNLAKKVVDNAVRIYEKDGMNGLAVASEHCYEKKTNKFLYCVFLDLASFHLDQLAGIYGGDFEYFTVKQIDARIYPLLTIGKMDIKTANQYVMRAIADKYGK